MTTPESTRCSWAGWKTDRMSRVDLVRVGDNDKPVLANLVQFYCYELSAVRRYEVTEHGLYVYRYLCASRFLEANPVLRTGSASNKKRAPHRTLEARRAESRSGRGTPEL
jgi:hypothetical protein